MWVLSRSYNFSIYSYLICGMFQLFAARSLSSLLVRRELTYSGGRRTEGVCGGSLPLEQPWKRVVEISPVQHGRVKRNFVKIFHPLTGGGGFNWSVSSRSDLADCPAKSMTSSSTSSGKQNEPQHVSPPVKKQTTHAHDHHVVFKTP